MSLSVDKALRKAQSHMRAGDLGEAEELYKQVLSKFPKNKKAVQGYQKLKVGITSKGSLATEPPHEQVQELVGLYNQGRFEEVLSKTKHMARLFPKSAEMQVFLGEAYRKLNMNEAAIESYQNVLKVKPRYAEAYYNMGIVLKEKGDLDLAVDSFKQAINIKPDYAEACYNMGISLEGKSDLDAAIDSYKKAINIKPDYAEAYSAIAFALHDKNDLDAAIDSYKQAVKIKPDYAEAYSSMGVALHDKNDLAAAIDSYKQAIKINPNYTDAYYNMGNALKDKGELDAAIESYKQAIKISPNYAEVYSNLGATLKDKGDLDAAIDSYKKALEINPDFNQVKHLLASLIGETTNSAPREYVERLFEGYASKFDRSLIEELEYKIPKVIAEMVFKMLPNKTLGSVLDLGCGTGLAGLELKQFSQNLEGIDLSESMLEQARKKSVYDKLIHGDIVEHLSTTDLDFDYFLSTDVFVYVGDLSDIFRLIKTRNNRCGRLVFSTEHTEREGFHLEKSGRYSHSKTYIESLCFKYDYHLSHFEKANLRKEKRKFITGGLYLLDF